MASVLKWGSFAFVALVALSMWYSVAPMFERMHEISRVAVEVERKYQRDPVRLVDCVLLSGGEEGRQCLSAIGRLGPAAASVAPALARLCFAPATPKSRWFDHRTADVLAQVAGVRRSYEKDSPPDPRDTLRLAMEKLGPGVVDAFAADLDSPVPDARWRAVYALGFTGAAGAKYAPKVVALASSADPIMRGEAARTLGAMGREAFDSAGCLMPDMRFDADEPPKRGLEDALKATAYPFGEWQTAIGRCSRR